VEARLGRWDVDPAPIPNGLKSQVDVRILTELGDQGLAGNFALADLHEVVGGVELGHGDAYRIVRDSSTGTSIFHIQGLNAFFLDQSEFVVTNGLVLVATAKSYIRQHRARVFSSAAVNALGTITSTAVTDGTVSLQVINGNNQTLMAVYTIPSNRTGMLVRWWGSMSKKQSASSVVNLRAGQLDKIGYIVQNRSVKSNGSSAFDHRFDVPILFPGGSDMWIEADSDTNDIGIAGGFDIVLIEEGA